MKGLWECERNHGSVNNQNIPHIKQIINKTYEMHTPNIWTDTSLEDLESKQEKDLRSLFRVQGSNLERPAYPEDAKHKENLRFLVLGLLLLIW